MPAEDASDAEWDAWGDFQELQAILAGLVSRAGERQTEQDDTHWHNAVSDHLANPAVLALLGEAAHDGRAVAPALGQSG